MIRIKSDINWMEEHAMRIKWKTQKGWKFTQVEFPIDGIYTRLEIRAKGISQIVQHSVAIQRGNGGSVNRANLKLQGIETEKGALRESSWGPPPPMIHPHGGVRPKSHSSKV